MANTVASSHSELWTVRSSCPLVSYLFLPWKSAYRELVLWIEYYRTCSSLSTLGVPDSHNAIRVIQYQTLQFKLSSSIPHIHCAEHASWPVVNHADQQVSFEGPTSRLGFSLALRISSSGHVSWVCYTNSIVCWFRLVGVVSVFLNFSARLVSLFLSHFALFQISLSFFRATCWWLLTLRVCHSPRMILAFNCQPRNLADLCRERRILRSKAFCLIYWARSRNSSKTCYNVCSSTSLVHFK